MKIRSLLRSPASRNLALAAVFFLAGATLFLLAPKKEDAKIAQAQVSGTYTADWQATHLIVARLTRPDIYSSEQNCESVNSVTGPYGDPSNSEAAIGPSRWEVRGQLDDGSRFKEIWAVPTLPTRITFGEGTWFSFNWWGGGCSDAKLKVMGNQNPTDWIIGFFNDLDLGYSAIDFRTVGVNDSMTNISNLEPGNVRNIGKTTSCQWTNRCIFTTGPYAWTTFHEIDEASNSKYLNVGTLVPARWNVTGFLCSPGDTRCN